MNYEIKHYSFDFNSDGFTVKFKKLPLSQYIISTTIGSLFSLLVLWISILAFSSNMLFYAIAFSLFFLCLTYFVFWLDLFRWIIREKRFAFKLNKDGIFCSEINKSFFIGWDELESFGFVERNRYRARGDCFQTCIYFSKNIINEARLRKKCRDLCDLPYMHNSSNGMIVFGFIDLSCDEALSDRNQDKQTRNEILEKIRTTVNMYVEPSKEKDFLDR